MVVREPGGRLRTATVEEHDRMQRIFFPQEDRPVRMPDMFQSEHLQVPSSALLSDCFYIVK